MSTSVVTRLRRLIKQKSAKHCLQGSINDCEFDCDQIIDHIASLNIHRIPECPDFFALPLFGNSNDFLEFTSILPAGFKVRVQLEGVQDSYEVSDTWVTKPFAFGYTLFGFTKVRIYVGDKKVIILERKVKPIFKFRLFVRNISEQGSH